MFKAKGKNTIPVAIIENGTKIQERLAVGTIDTILNIVNEKGLTNPSIIVVGETVKESEVLYSQLLTQKGKSL